MKASEFVKVLRKVIREEVRAVVKEEIKLIKPVILEAVRGQNNPKAVVSKKQSRAQPLVTMESLDGMLSEGVFDTEEWPDMNGGPMTSDIFASNSDFGIAGFTPQQVQPQRGSVGMKDPLLKDYSQVLKAADAHAQGYRGV